jgi:hypothetical protein
LHVYIQAGLYHEKSGSPGTFIISIYFYLKSLPSPKNMKPSTERAVFN